MNKFWPGFAVAMCLVLAVGTVAPYGARAARRYRTRADSLCAYVLKSATASDTLLVHRRFGCNLEASR